jgi:hypothetical protein
MNTGIIDEKESSLTCPWDFVTLLKPELSDKITPPIRFATP